MQTVAVARDGALGRARSWIVLPWVIVAIGIPVSLLLFDFVGDAIERTAQQRFERQASDAKHSIEARVNSYGEILYGMAALFTSQDAVSRLQFHNYVESLDLKARYPGFDVVNYAALVRDADRKRFEETVRSDTSLDPRGYPQFTIKPPGQRPEYYVLVYVEPMAGFEFAFGLDTGVNPAVRDSRALAEAVRETRDSGKLTSSGLPIRIRSPKDGRDYIGLAMRIGVYRSSMPRRTVEQRRAAFFGSVGAGFNVENLMNGVLDEQVARYLRFKLYDVGAVAESPASRSKQKMLLLFDSNQLAQSVSAPTDEAGAGSFFTGVLPMEVGGRIWQVHFSAPKQAIIDGADAILPWMVLGAGLLSTALLSVIFYSLASSRSRALGMANEMTRDLRNSTEQLQAMSRQLVDVQESERRQIARELHDRVGQNLTAISINLDIMKSQIGEGGSSALRTRLDDAAALLESTSGSIENVMSELRPPMLDDYGLLPALQWYGEEFWRRTGIRVRVEGDEQMERVPQTSEIALFRIAQEALNNVTKHAHARHVDIALARNGSHVVMSVSDDGMGFDAAPAMASRRRRPGLGMVTMRERTQAVGGQFEIGPAPGRGARVVVRVPC
jgi:signal transduction histidine kinase